PAEKLSLEAISRSLTEHQVTTLWLTAGLFQIMIEECPEALSGLRQLITGGDVMTVNHASRLLEMHPHIHLINGYGPTENVTFSATHRVTKSDLTRTAIPIGRPVPNSTIWILDQDRKPVQPGVAAELFTGGDGVAIEYINDPVRTAEKFLPDPFSDDPHGRLYATGDLGRCRHDGTIEFLGRIDHQIKIRGFRVEPGEIESLLSRHPRVGQCKIVVSGSLASDKSLHAYVKPLNGVKPSAAELSEYLRSSLPEYLIPSRILVLDEMPLNANGKIDTRSLPEICAAEPLISRESTATEKSLTEMWSDFLRIPHPELDDDFFSLGGHSLLGMKLFVRIQKQFGISLPLATIFKAPTIRKLAALIDEKQSSLDPSETKITAQKLVVDTACEAAEPAHSLSTITKKQTIAETTVAIRSEGHLPPLFAVHGGNGGILFYGNLAERLGNDRPFYAFEAPALTAGGPLPEESVEETAAKYLQELQKVQPVGPYHLCGYSFGGVVAYEMARQLLAAGETVEFLGLVDTENPSVDGRKLSLGERVSVNWKNRNESEAGTIERVSNLGRRIGSGLGYRLRFGAEDAIASSLPSSNKTGWLRQVQLRKAHERAMEAYLPGKFSGKLTLFRAMVGNDKFDIGDDYGWAPLVDELEVIAVPGNHISIFHRDNIDAVSEAFRNCLTPSRELRSSPTLRKGK
nr:AMP-binding protein [Verrucomicrobiales bacterium]